LYYARFEVKSASPTPSDREFYWRAGTRAASRVVPWKLVRAPVAGQPGSWQTDILAADLGEKTILAAGWSQWRAVQAP